MSDENLISRVYSGFRGVDFRGEEINLVRSPDALNVWKDYKCTESIRTRPEMELKVSFDDTIYGVFFFNDEMLVHSGTKLYKVVNGVKTELYSDLREANSDSFIFYDDNKGKHCWFFKDGKHYLQYDGETIGDVVGYVPTTSIGRRPAGGGTTKEYVNFLSSRRINTFLSDSVSTEYFLDYLKIDEDFKPVVKILNGKGKWQEVTDCFEVDYEEGKIIFNASFTLEGIVDENGEEKSLSCPPMPFTDGQDNVSIEYSKTNTMYRETILKCTLLQVFDNRVFFSGHPDYPNRIYNCNLNDPTYCDDRDHYQEGTDNAKVKGMVAGNNALWVFREPSQANTTVFYHTPTIDEAEGKIYPNTHSSVSTGCIGKAINFNDDIVFFSERGMEGISGDITTEQVLGHRSSLVDSKMIAEKDYKNMTLAEWEGYLFVFIGNKAYLADSRATFTNENHFEYDWFYWQMPKAITCARVEKGILYLGTEDGVYTLTDTKSAVESYWVTPKDKFKYPHKLKTTNKRGCVVEATGDVSVYAKLEDTGFELIGKYENVTDYFVSRIKRKKFKDLQLKFYSPTGFSLETATLECFIGGYIKR